MDDLTDRVRRAYAAARSTPTDVDVDLLLEQVHAGAQRRVRRRKAALAGAAGVALVVVAGGVGASVLTGTGSDVTTAEQGATYRDEAGGSAGGSAANGQPAPSSTDAIGDEGGDEGGDKGGDKGGDEGRVRSNSEAGAPVPANLSVTSVTAVSPNTFWVLGTSDGAPTLVRTTDGGTSFTEVGVPEDTAAAEVRFVDGSTGWLRGERLWSTRDGGASWTPVDGPTDRVQRLEAGGGYVYALTETQLWRGSTDNPTGNATGEESWQPLDVDLTQPEDLAVTNDLVIVTDRTETATKVLVSGTAGESFDEHTTPCAPELAAGTLSATADDGIWLSCPTGMAASVLRSTDGGASWEPAPTGEDAPPNAAVVAARDSDRAVLAFDGRVVPLGALELSSGAGPHEVPELAQPTYAGFTTPDVGYLIDTEGALFRTTDGGQSWTRVTFG